MTPRSVFGWAFVIPLVLGACSSSSSDTNQARPDGGFVGPNGCSAAPDCSACNQCFDTCLCTTGDAMGCLAQCAGTGTGGAAGTPGNGGAPSGGGAPNGGSPGGGGAGNTGNTGGGGGDCNMLTTGNPQCDSCLHGTCCSAANTCLANPACSGLVSCISQACAQASDLTSCVQQYCSQYSAGISDYSALGQCLQSCGC